MTVTHLPIIRTASTGRLRVLVVSESFLPQINGVTNSVRRVLEHLSTAGHDALLVAPTGPATYAGFPVVRARGASLWFYRDFRIGLETRRRLRTVMQRFRPDVVHIASPATLGYQAAGSPASSASRRWRSTRPTWSGSPSATSRSTASAGAPARWRR